MNIYPLRRRHVIPKLQSVNSTHLPGFIHLSQCVYWFSTTTQYNISTGTTVKTKPNSRLAVLYVIKISCSWIFRYNIGINIII